jgi:hypothetical protein
LTSTSHSSVRGPALEAEDGDLRLGDRNRPDGGYEAGRHRDSLCAPGGVSDYAPAERAAEFLTPELLAAGVAERIKVSADVAEFLSGNTYLSLFGGLASP